jgi:enoyl ACP reductase
MLDGKRLLITGVLTRKSIAFAAAREAQLAGAEVVLTGFGRTRRMTERAAARLPEPPDVLELDVNSEEDLAGLAEELEGRWDGLDGALHAIAFAPEDAIGGRFMETPAESALEAFRTSANLISAGPIASPAAGGIPGFDDLADGWPEAAPLGWDVDDPTPVARVICFLLSDWSEAISGELIHVDGGAHALGAVAEHRTGSNGAVKPPKLVGSG